VLIRSRRSRFLFLDLHLGGPSDSILVVGSQRSGTTWLAELINYRNEFRTIWEPLNPVRSPLARQIGFAWGQYLPPGEDDPELERVVRRICRGRVRHPWLEWNNTKRLVTKRRIIKCVAATNIVPWLTDLVPELKIVYLLRHPFAFAESQLDLQWNENLLSRLREQADLLRAVDRNVDDPDRVRALISNCSAPFDELVVRWCLENTIPLSELGPTDVHVVLYESIVMDPRGELARLGRYLGTAFGDEALQASVRPSRTDFRGRAPAPLAVGQPDAGRRSWLDRVTDEDVAHGLEILESFELDWLYGSDPFPLVSGAEVLRCKSR
jgi:hypothetical protein